ncbi:MAG: hypothetical protein ACTJGR_05350 [Pauljensenia sp.]
MTRMLVRVLGEWVLVIAGFWLMSALGGVFSDEVARADLSSGAATGGVTVIVSFLVATALSLYMTALAATHTAELRDAFSIRRTPRPATSD